MGAARDISRSAARARLRANVPAWVPALLCVAALSACDEAALAPSQTVVTPEARPAPVAAPPPVTEAEPTPPSAASREIAAYYSRVQADNLARGLLRTDGGGPDTPFTDTMLVRNFMAIALEEEYIRGEGLRPAGPGASSAVKKWTQPVRVTTEFGPGVPREQIDWDRAEVAKYAARLGRITGHPVSMSNDNPNFYVLFMSEDDQPQIANRIRQLVPDVNPNALRIFRNLPRGIHCLVMAFATDYGGYDYGTAIAVIRSEHPDLMRRSCVHEEMAQGFGLTNDSPSARPTIFNDDDEFALLTRHDELLLKILYDPRLRPGMSAEEALPIVREKAADLVGSGNSS
ncbi:DUF2927 domain-containing protein [Sagittula sp. MA-2]|jgi:hypothetical protein|uniref:DUF2927 domain-containing protein n=1 Tax=Sagittula sp. MA-2 TaxID=3048007 RepID=UPI0024C3206F|nr:DUF2927 domain-containing protein [Sagittula sp. MA-2]WHZ35585.1 DUF2927 domain-containing protein [Sagittula sp. MA-2]